MTRLSPFVLGIWVAIGAILVAVLVLGITWLMVDAVRGARVRRQRQQEAAERAAYYHGLMDAGAHRVRAGWWSIPGTKREEG